MPHEHRCVARARQFGRHLYIELSLADEKQRRRQTSERDCNPAQQRHEAARFVEATRQAIHRSQICAEDRNDLTGRDRPRKKARGIRYAIRGKHRRRKRIADREAPAERGDFRGVRDENRDKAGRGFTGSLDLKIQLRITRPVRKLRGIAAKRTCDNCNPRVGKRNRRLH